MKVILENIENRICTLTINRPNQYNALNIDVLKDPNQTEVDKWFSNLMGDDVEPRREFILTKAKYAKNIDI